MSIPAIRKTLKTGSSDIIRNFFHPYPAPAPLSFSGIMHGYSRQFPGSDKLLSGAPDFFHKFG
jgi:hypothetical protein